jgi:S-DNA-T family DNA segregation ATPase FtsK/SpoIIIE
MMFKRLRHLNFVPLWFKKIHSWFNYEGHERLHKRVIAIWSQAAIDDLQNAVAVLVNISQTPSFEVSIPQQKIDQAVRLILRYETIKSPYRPLNFRLALRLGLHAPAIRKRFLWLLGSAVGASFTIIILHWMSWFPFDWFPISLLTVAFFIIVCTFKGYKLFPIIRAFAAEHEASEHLFYASLADLHKQAKALLSSKRIKTMNQIQTAIHSVGFQQRQAESIYFDKSNELVVNEPKSAAAGNNASTYYPMKKAWERFFNEVFRLKEGTYDVPLHRDLGTTEIYVWDIPSIAFSRWEENLTRIEAYLKKVVFSVYRDFDGIGTVGVEIAKQPLPKEIIFQHMIDLHAATQASESVIVGVNCKGTVAWNYRKIPHGLVAGTTGAGKSTALYSIILQLQRQAHLPVFIDLKGGVSFGFVEDVDYPVATTKEAALQLVKGAVQEVERREKLLKEWGVSPDITVYNEMTGSNLPEIFIVFDEFAQFTDKWQGLDEGMACIKTIAAKGRSNGVHLLIATQRPSQESLGSTDFRSNISFRCIGRMDSQASSQIALGNSAAFERLPSTDYSGLFIVRGTDAPMDSLMKIPFINDIDFRRLFLGYRNPHEGYAFGSGIQLNKSDQQEVGRNYNDIF